MHTIAHTHTLTQMVDSKRRSLEEAAQQKREERNKTELKNWENRFSFRETEARLKEDEDRLRDLSVSSRHTYAYSIENFTAQYLEIYGWFFYHLYVEAYGFYKA